MVEVIKQASEEITIHQKYRIGSDDGPRILSTITVCDPITPPTESEYQGVSYSFTTYYVDYEPPTESYLTAEEYPVLAQIWDNDDDAIFDNM